MNCDLDNDLLEEKLSLLLLHKNRRRRRAQRAFRTRHAKPTFWIRQIFSKREELGEYNRFIHDLKNEDRGYFFKYLEFLFGTEFIITETEFS